MRRPGDITDLDEDADLSSISLEMLIEYKNIVEKCSELMKAPQINENPVLLEQNIKSMLNKYKTMEAKLSSTQKEVLEIGKLPKAEADYELIKTNKENEINRLDKQIEDIEKEKSAIENEVLEEKKSLPTIGVDSSVLASSNNELGQLEMTLKNIRSEIDQKQKAKQEFEKQIRDLDVTFNETTKRINDLKERLECSDDNTIAQRLAEKQIQTQNLQKAFDSLVSEAQKKVNARHQIIMTKKESIRNEIAGQEEVIERAEKELQSITHMLDEISKFEVLIAREERRKEAPEENSALSKAFNKSRVSRLILLLFTEGPSNEIVNSLADELSWNPKQTNDFLTMVRGNSTKTIGSLWAEWLDSIANE